MYKYIVKYCEDINNCDTSGMNLNADEFISISESYARRAIVRLIRHHPGKLRKKGYHY